MNCCPCRTMKTRGSGMIAVPRKGAFLPIRRRVMRGNGAILLPAIVSTQQPRVLSDPISLTSGGAMNMKPIKTDIQRVVDKLEKMNLKKPQNIRKNIRVSL